MAERQAHGNTFLVPVLAGLAGASIALLFAPRSGRETRQQLQETAAEAKRKTEEGILAARDKLDTGIDRAHDLKDRFTGAIKTSGKNSQESSRNNPASEESSVLSSWEREV